LYDLSLVEEKARNARGEVTGRAVGVAPEESGTVHSALSCPNPLVSPKFKCWRITAPGISIRTSDLVFGNSDRQPPMLVNGKLDRPVYNGRPSGLGGRAPIGANRVAGGTAAGVAVIVTVGPAVVIVPGKS